MNPDLKQLKIDEETKIALFNLKAYSQTYSELINDLMAIRKFVSGHMLLEYVCAVLKTEGLETYSSYESFAEYNSTFDFRIHLVRFMELFDVSFTSDQLSQLFGFLVRDIYEFALTKINEKYDLVVDSVKVDEPSYLRIDYLIVEREDE